MICGSQAWNLVAWLYVIFRVLSDFCAHLRWGTQTFHNSRRMLLDTFALIQTSVADPVLTSHELHRACSLKLDNDTGIGQLINLKIQFKIGVL